MDGDNWLTFEFGFESRMIFSLTPALEYDINVELCYVYIHRLVGLWTLDTSGIHMWDLHHLLPVVYHVLNAYVVCGFWHSRRSRLRILYSSNSPWFSKVSVNLQFELTGFYIYASYIYIYLAAMQSRKCLFWILPVFSFHNPNESTATVFSTPSATESLPNFSSSRCDIRYPKLAFEMFRSARHTQGVRTWHGNRSQFGFSDKHYRAGSWQLQCFFFLTWVLGLSQSG